MFWFSVQEVVWCWHLESQHLECGEGRAAVQLHSKFRVSTSYTKDSVSSHHAVLPKIPLCFALFFPRFFLCALAILQWSLFFPLFPDSPTFISGETLASHRLGWQSLLKLCSLSWGQCGSQAWPPSRGHQSQHTEGEETPWFPKKIKINKRDMKRLDSGTVDGIKTALENLR